MMLEHDEMWFEDEFDDELDDDFEEENDLFIEALGKAILKRAVAEKILRIEQISSLSHMPECCPQPRDLALTAKGYRYLIVEKYLMFYKVVEDAIQIHRIVYGETELSSLVINENSLAVWRGFALGVTSKWGLKGFGVPCKTAP